MTDSDVKRLLADKVIQRIPADQETAGAEIEVARRHILSARKIMKDDPALAFTGLYDAMRKAVVAHMRSRGFRIAKMQGSHKKTGEYASAALDHLRIGEHLDEFDALRNLRNQSEYDGVSLYLEDVQEALDHVQVIVEAIARDL